MSDPLAAGADVPVDNQTTLAMLETDPTSVYQRLRRHSPIVRVAAIGRIVFTKAEDVLRVKTDTAHFGSHDTTTPMQRAFGGHTLMRKDGCEHLRERRAMEPTFARNCLHHHWKAQFEDLTDQVLAELGEKQDVDLLPALAAPLTAAYLQLVLGVGQVGESQLFTWAQALIRGAMNASFDPKVFEISDHANAEMDHCFDAMIAKHMKTPTASVLSTMANGPDPIGLSQIRTNMKICIGGAVVETRDALLSTLYGLLSNPIQLDHCRKHNTWDRACEEGLRWVAPIQASPRLVMRSLTMRGMHIPKGETVMAIQASANHDEAIWTHPERFDAQRTPHDHQTFGDGPHQCLGGDIYRLLVADVVLPKLFTRFPSLSLRPDHAVKFKGFAFRGPTSLPVRLA
jgi:cytochrome P450